MDLLLPKDCGPPPPAAVYPDILTAFSALQAHARAHGYALFKRDSQPPKVPTRVIYACDREGKGDSRAKNPNIHEQRRRQGTRSKKCGCKMRIALKRDLISGQWEVQIIEGSHNHLASADPSAHPAHRLAALSSEIKAYIESLVCSGLSNAQILGIIRQKHGMDVLLAQKDVSNLAQKTRLKLLNGKTPMDWLFQVYIAIASSSNLLIIYLGVTRKRLPACTRDES